MLATCDDSYMQFEGASLGKLKPCRYLVYRIAPRAVQELPSLLLLIILVIRNS